jgi:hypothetical protein
MIIANVDDYRKQLSMPFKVASRCSWTEAFARAWTC